MKFKVGDKVRIVDKWVAGCSENNEGKMDKWLGKVMTIREVHDNGYRMEEDRYEHCNLGWYWREPCIAGYAFKYEVGQKLRINLRDNSHFGSIIQITDASYGRGAHYRYKYIKDTCPELFAMTGFDENSPFGCNLVPVEDSKVVITVDGNETIARMFENGECVKTATAKCNPSDEFNFETGARLAFERLFEEKPKFKAGDRVKIIGKKKLGHFFDIGEVVTVKTITENGNLRCATSNGFCQNVSPADVELVAFAVGDHVRIINGGEIFRYHEEWVKENVHDDKLRLYWAYGQNPYYEDGKTINANHNFVIKVIADNKALIQRVGVLNSECYVIGLDGIKKC